MQKYNLEFCFKGERDYVHGTDIFNKLIELFKIDIIEKKLDLSFHGVAKKNLEFSLLRPEDESLIKCIFKYKQDSQVVWYGIENNKNVDCRYEYEEESICQLSTLHLEEKNLVLQNKSNYSFIENIVALNKYLLENLFPDSDGKWYFTRLQLNRVIYLDIYSLELTLKANFNFKLTKTEIKIDNEFIGFIYFSLV